MTRSTLLSAMKFGTTATILAALLGLACMSAAAQTDTDKDKTKTPPKPAATKPAPPPKPAGTPAGTATHGPTANASTATHGPTANGGSATHGPTANASTATHGPTANAPVSHGPTANPTGAPANKTVVGATRTINTGSPGNTTAVGGARVMNGVGAGNTTTVGGARTNNAFGQPGNLNRPPIGTTLPKGNVQRTTRTGAVISTRPNGKLSNLSDPARGLNVHQGLNGNRTISVVRPDQSRIVATPGRAGYVQHPYSVNGRNFAQRTIVNHGMVSNQIYQGLAYRGQNLSVYSPKSFFSGALYGWAYNKFAHPTAIGGGLIATGGPWSTYYAFYFQADPTYAAPPAFLTDYIISTDLQAAYAAQQQAGEANGAPQAAGGPPILSPDIKQQIANEVQSQLALENQEGQQNTQGQAPDPGSSGIPRLLSDGQAHVFVVGAPLDVTNSSQAECALSDGDVLQLPAGSGAPAAGATTVSLVVLASKGGQECQQSSTVTVQLTDLQEMQNSMRANIDQGLQNLQSKQGTAGVPALPAAAQSQPAPAQYAAIAPPPDPNAGAEIQQQTQQANQAEQQAASQPAQDPNAAPAAPPVDPNANAQTPQPDANAQAAQPNPNAQPAQPDANAQAAPAPAPAGATTPPSVSLGMTTDQVQAALGPPTSIANLGAKVIYNYNGMKVIFQNGVVSDVQ